MIYEKDENNKQRMTKNEFACNQLLNYLNDNNLIYFTQLASNWTFNRTCVKDNFGDKTKFVILVYEDFTC